MGYIKDIVDEVKAKLLAPRPLGRGIMPMDEEPKPVAPKVIYHDSQSEDAIGIQLYVKNMRDFNQVGDYEYGSSVKVYADRACTKDPDWKAILSKNPYLPIYISNNMDSSDVPPEHLGQISGGEAFVMSQTIRLDRYLRISCFTGDVVVYHGTIPLVIGPGDANSVPIVLNIGVITDPSALEFTELPWGEIGYLSRIDGYANRGE